MIFRFSPLLKQCFSLFLVEGIVFLASAGLFPPFVRVLKNPMAASGVQIRPLKSEFINSAEI